MPTRVEFATEARTDLRDIYRYNVSIHREAFGRNLPDARRLASERIRKILDDGEALVRTPRIGTRHDDLAMGLRHVTVDRTIFWFVLLEEGNLLRITGIFRGGQDHFGRMMQRLTQPR